MSKKRKRVYGTGSVYKNTPTARTFSVQWRDLEGVPHRRHGFLSRPEAETALQEELVKTHTTPTMFPNAKVALNVLAEPWFAARDRTHAAARSDRSRWATHLARALGHLRPADVSTAVLKSFVHAKIAAGVSGATLQLTVRLLSSFFTDLVEAKAVATNPVKDLPKKTKRLLRSAHSPEQTPFLTNQAVVLAAMGGAEAVAFAVGTYAGLRTSEVLGLTWENVDLANRKVRVCQQIVDGQVKTVLKDRAPRNTIIPDALAPVLTHYKEVSGGVGLLFPGYTKKKLSKALSKALLALGQPRMRWYHATRHTFASHWVINGGSIEVLKELLGHSSVLVTERYAHLRLNQFNAADLARFSQPAAIEVGQSL